MTGPLGTALAINNTVAHPERLAIETTDTQTGKRPEESRTSLSWALPMTGKLVVNEGSQVQPVSYIMQADQPRQLQGTISTHGARCPVAARINELLDISLDRNARTSELDRTALHYNKLSQRALAQTKDATDYLVPYRGFGPSIEAGNVILGENVSARSKAAAEYLRQKHVDETHLKVVTGIMQLAMGLGMQDRARAEKVSSSGQAALAEIVGQEEAERTMGLLSTWAQELAVPESVYAQGAWDIAERKGKLSYVMENSLESDSVIGEIKRRLHKYNRKSRFARISSSIVQTTLGTASLAPNFVGPAAKTALLAFVMATGGPERCKLLKELYLDKRFESRWKVLNEEAHMALESYQVSLLTRNPVLLAASESVVAELIGEEYIPGVFGVSVLDRSAADYRTNQLRKESPVAMRD